MDITLARTFLEIVSTGNFVNAARSLNVTQTAISARVRSLEEQLGRRLFVRHRGGTQLTAAGARFQPHAVALVQSWERARRELALPSGITDLITVGGQFALANPLLSDLLVWARRHHPGIAIRVDLDTANPLLDRVESGNLDIAVLHNPPTRPDLVFELIREEKLVMVTASTSGELRPETHVHVDWGAPFAESHRIAFPELQAAPVTVSLGQIALPYLLAVGGSGYFRSAIVQPFIDNGQLFPVPSAPEFSYSIYAVYARRDTTGMVEAIRTGLKACASGKAGNAPGG